MDEAHGVFQAAEGGFNALASGVEDFERDVGEPVRVEIGDKGFRIAAAGLQTDNSVIRITFPETRERSAIWHRALHSFFSCSFCTIKSV